MNGSSHHKDIYFQMDALRTTVTTTYGHPVNAPFPGVPAGFVNIPAHSHLPTAAAVKIVADTYRNSPITNTPADFAGGDGSPGIWPHFDVGDPASYITALGSSYAPFFVPAQHAKGGHLVDEKRCGVSDTEVDSPNGCPFYYFPGTTGWMRGVLQLEESTNASGQPDGMPFDPARLGIFHHAVYVHARGVRKSTFPCVDATGQETLYGDPTAETCAAGHAPNPLFRVPKTLTGVAQRPGQRLMVSTGLWDIVNGVGTDENVASTTLHEAGHNNGLGHGGPPPVWTITVNGVPNFPIVKLGEFRAEPNCKPSYTSIMSYLFQIPGERDDLGNSYFDYSRDAILNRTRSTRPRLPRPSFRCCSPTGRHGLRRSCRGSRTRLRRRRDSAAAWISRIHCLPALSTWAASTDP